MLSEVLYANIRAHRCAVLYTYIIPIYKIIIFFSNFNDLSHGSLIIILKNNMMVIFCASNPPFPLSATRSHIYRYAFHTITSVIHYNNIMLYVVHIPRTVQTVIIHSTAQHRPPTQVPRVPGSMCATCRYAIQVYIYT